MWHWARVNSMLYVLRIDCQLVDCLSRASLGCHPVDAVASFTRIG
jgi:hypothetical protein